MRRVSAPPSSLLPPLACRLHTGGGALNSAAGAAAAAAAAQAEHTRVCMGDGTQRAHAGLYAGKQFQHMHTGASPAAPRGAP